MLKKIAKALGIGANIKQPIKPVGMHHPYNNASTDFFYNLLFCDDPALLSAADADNESPVWRTLVAEKADRHALITIAEDENLEGRVRAFAYNRLRAENVFVPPKKLLGVIVEVPLEQGLDVLAAFVDGGVRYLNQSGKITVCDGGGTPVAAMAKELTAAAEPVLAMIGPWTRPRLPPPPPGQLRLTFVVSDGLYIGQGRYEALNEDPMAAPLLAKAVRLVQLVTDITLKAQAGGK